MARTISGKDITAAASTAPRQLKAKLMPNQSYSQLPINPRRPMATSSRYPTTTGGSTSGRWRRLSSSALPGKVRLTSSQEKDAKGQAQGHRQGGDFQAQQHRLPFGFAQKHQRVVNP